MRNVTLTLATLSLAGACAQEAETPPVRAGYTPINGVTYYHEIHGAGEPLLLLHGGLGSIDMFGPVLDTLAASHEVIAVDLHGHGRTTLGDRPINLSDIGDDLAILLDTLGYDQVDVAGYSLGGGVGFRLAVQHPEKVRRLVLVSAGYSTEGFYPEMLPQQAQVSAAAAPMMKDTPMYKTYAAVAPHPEEFPILLDRLGDLMRTPYDYSADIAKLKMPVELVYGDSDMFTLDHAVDFYHRLGGGLQDAGWQREHQSQNRLAILPNVTHYDMFLSPLFTSTILDFLDPKPAQAWVASAK